jgi:hypothetical protein
MISWLILFKGVMAVNSEKYRKTINNKFRVTNYWNR